MREYLVTDAVDVVVVEIVSTAAEHWQVVSVTLPD
jgi:hypothetical protein